MAQLYGSCACERNQYTVIVPRERTSLAQVFFDNSMESRRTQATPVTAWLRVPLDWYHSTTYAIFPDESHSTIKRTFHTPSAHAALPPIRRQFCGYCGTHLTAWSDEDHDAADHMDVTLGSLLGESLDQLEALNIIPPTAEEHDDYDDEMVKGGVIDDEEHIPSSEGTMGGMEGPGAVTKPALTSNTVARRRMQNRGMPYFEEMVENSRLGRIKRQKGGHTSQDGTTTVQWEVVEMDSSDAAPLTAAAELVSGEERSKRRKTGS